VKETSPEKIDYSSLPSVDHLLAQSESLDLPHVLTRSEARLFIAELRDNIQKGRRPNTNPTQDFLNRLQQVANPLIRVINGTGVVIHTNLGRSPMSKDSYAALELLKDSYINLEMDLDDGKRSNRHNHLRPWIRALSGADNGILVNNNAAAVLLALNSMADRKEVIISRGQLVEIGGSFRIPEILKKAGSKLVEVGTTNRTHTKDYAEAITSRTRLLLWVHSSNYKISGFTKEVALPELVALGKEHGIPVMADLGSGALVGIDQYGLQREPLVSEVMAAGVDIVTFSVDKLLAGPQGGIIAGNDTIIKKIEKNNLLRALRPDKTQILLTLHALKQFYSATEAPRDVPVYRDFQTAPEPLMQRARHIVSQVSNKSLALSIVETQAQVGSGASPSETMPSVGIQIQHGRLKAHRLALKLRTNTPAILGRVSEDICFIDLKAVRANEDAFIIEALTKLN